MKGFAVIIIIGTLAMVSCETDTISEKSENIQENVQQPDKVPNIYSLLSPPSSQNDFNGHTKMSSGHNEQDGQNEPSGLNGPLITRPLGEMAIFMREFVPQIIVVGLIGIGLWFFGAFLKTFVTTKLQHLLPLVSLYPNQRNISSHVDDLTETILAAISSKECLERASCELGQRAKHLQVTEGVIPVLDKVSSRIIVQAFQHGLNGSNLCEKYHCNITPS